MSADQQPDISEVINQNRPDFASLFGSLELCDCQHCFSVHSPAAYLVDLLQFLGPTPLDILIGNSEKKISGRRPDIAHIQLSCENTNTTLPYVDLVNEVLESYIVFRQTLPLRSDDAGAVLVPPVPRPNESSLGITAAELAANPENTRDLAYEAVEDAVYPFTLPFNQPIAAFRLNLEQMGSSRHEVMDLFRRDDSEATKRALDVEALKLTEREFAILTGEQFDALPTAKPVSDFYGFEAPVAPTDTAWVAGGLPVGAEQHVNKDSWTFAAFATPPPSGVTPHASAVAAGLHQHYFDKVNDASKLKVESEDFLFAEIFLDPGNLPQEVMLQWNDGTNDGAWEHRAYWGLSKIALGVESTASRRYMGPIPSAGVWVPLEVPAYFVGMVEAKLSGMAFTLFGGGATWGAAGKRSPSWVEQLTHVPTLLARTGISYVELIELLRTRYVNPALPQGAALEAFERIPLSYGVLAALVASNFVNPDAKTIETLDDAKMTVAELETWAGTYFKTISKMIVLDAPDSACDLTLTRLQHLDGTLLDDDELSPLHRFIRLWRKTGWSVQDLDRAMVALQAPDITPRFLRQLGQIVQLQETLELSPQQLLSFWGSIPIAGDDALYRKLFLNKAVRDIDPIFLAVNGEYLAATDLRIGEHVPALLAGLRTRATDLALIREHAQWTIPGAPPTLVTFAGDKAPLTLATATILYRYVTLARALKMAVKDLIALQALSGKSPFSKLSDTNLKFEASDIDPARTLGFVQLANRVAQSGFTPGTLSYLFNSVDDAPRNFAPPDESIRLQLATIREGLVRIASENVPADDPTGDLTRAKLSLVFELHVVEQIAGLVAGTSVYSVPLAALPAGVVLPEGKVGHDEKSRLLKTSAWLTDAEKATLLALSLDVEYQKSVQSLYDQPRNLLMQTLTNRLAWKSVETDLQVSVLEAPSIGADGKVDPALVAGKFKVFLAGALPYLRAVLSRALVKQTLADVLSLEPATAALLLEGADDVVPLGTNADTTVPAITKFLALAGDGLTADYFANETLTGPPQTSRVDATIDFRWDAKRGFGARWTGKVLADKTQTYQFHLRAGGGVRFTIDGKLPLLIDQWNDAAPAEYTVACDMEAGKFYDLKLEYFNLAYVAEIEPPALVELRWSSPSIPAEIVPSYRLYSTKRGDASKAAEQTYIRLHKAALLVNGFTLKSREIAYLARPTVSGGGLAHPNAFDLNKLPVEAAPADQHVLFTAWTRWNDFAALRARTTNDPASLVDTLNASTSVSAQAALVQATGWDAKALAALAGAQGFGLSNADYSDVAKLLDLADAMRLLNKLGAPAAEVFAWAAFAPNMGQSRIAAQEAKRAHKAQYDNEAWLEIARSIADRLRDGQRAALVAYLLPRLGFTGAGELFGHFLIDVEMGPCMHTSRIKQAISSVQLFIQRCRMNLEPEVAPKMIDNNRWQWMQNRWQWMQNYRVWEANLKIFLYPENWIEPELRDDKSQFFRELESELLQGEVTTETAEIALGNYLEKLDSVSQLNICGMYEETILDPDEGRQSVFHVFGHTFATPRVFYYRQQITVDPNYRYWTAWERVPLDIEADELLPVIWNRRLYLFWQVITEKSDTSKRLTSPTFIIRMAWSEYRHGKWSPKQVTAADDALAIPSPPPGTIPPKMDAEITDGELTIVFATPFQVPIDPGTSIIETAPNGRKSDNVLTFGHLTFRNYNGLVEPTVFKDMVVNYDHGFLPTTTTTLEFLAVVEPDRPFDVLSRIPQKGGMRLFSPGVRPYTLDDPFFLQEGPRAYLVLPRSLDLGPDGITTAEPYLLGYKEGKTASAINQELGRPFHALLEELSTAAHPWLASGAGIAVAELRNLSLASAGQTTAVKDSSLDNQVVKPGVLPLGVISRRRYLAEFRFETFFHPYAAEFQKRLNRYGVSGLLNIDSQRPQGLTNPSGLPILTSFKEAYHPNTLVKESRPEHKVDFAFTGAYSLYNWELFFHVPLFLAMRLSANQCFEEAMRWFHFIFDPTAAASSAEPAPQCYWNVLPFRAAQALRLDDMLKAMKAGNADLIAQWEDLQAHPFQPHRVARMRLIAYQKTVVMKYIDNLVAWADQLFRRDTIETINQAAHLYVMAAELLGPLPQRLPQRGRNQSKTYDQLRTAGLDKLNQAMVLFENDPPFSSRATAGDSPTEATGLLGIGRTSYFCIPKNDKLLGYWETVADRLFKIRHCMNIEGVMRELPLFEPPIDPALLVQAAAQGIDLSSVLNDLSAPLPFYRFSTLLGKALELTGELRSLGAALLAALEKRDAEHLVKIRATHETELLSLVKHVKQQQLEEARIIEEGLRKSREVTQARYDFYNNIPQRIEEETNQLNELKAGQDFQRIGQTAENTISDITTNLPDITTGWSYTTATGWSQKADVTIGRVNVISYYQAKSRHNSYEASVRSSWANDASILGSWRRRADDWKLQKDLAFKELAQIDKQIAAANIRVAVAQQDLDNTTRQIEQSQEVEEFLRTKFTGEELYSWMHGEISTIYFQCYQMTYDLAKKAERCYRFERGLVNSNLIQFGAWDSLRKGLLSGERLYMQLKQMERAYMDGNRREYELTKHYSLVLNDPQALISLKGLGQCQIELPEALFDTDYPGHYMRRVKNVSLTLPAVVGPYTGLNCTLTLLRDKTRVKATPGDGYTERDGEEDDRFLTNWAPLQAIATSTGQNDAGLFELNFRDERYLPFEGAGVISRWRIALDPDANGFDFDTLSDVVLHIRYTAREGGERLKQSAKTSLVKALGGEAIKPLARLFSLKHEFPTEWHRFTHPAAPAVGTFTIDKERFPFLFRGKSKTLTVGKVYLHAVLKDGAEPASPLSVVLTPPGGEENRIEFELREKWRKIQAPKNTPDVETEITARSADSKWVLKTDSSELAKNVDDLLLMCEYTVELNR